MHDDRDCDRSELLSRDLVRDAQLAALRQFADRIAHDLRNPLGVVRNAIFLLKRKVPAEEAKWHEYFDTIEQATVVAEQVLADLVAAARVKPPARRPVELDRILAAARAAIQAPEGIRWQFTLPAQPLVMNIDAAQWERVFRALFSNAVEALGSEGEVTVRAARTHADDEILVTDTGPGIPPEVRPQVFEPLFSTKPRAAGLGLTVAQHIVRQHGGTLELAECAAGGAFLIRLPVD